MQNPFRWPPRDSIFYSRSRCSLLECSFLLSPAHSIGTRVLMRRDAFPQWLSGKESACQCRRRRKRRRHEFNPLLGRSPAVGIGNPLEYSCLGNPRNRGAWQVTVHRATDSDTTEHTHTWREMDDLLAGSPLTKSQVVLWEGSFRNSLTLPQDVHEACTPVRGCLTWGNL